MDAGCGRHRGGRYSIFLRRGLAMLARWKRTDASAADSPEAQAARRIADVGARRGARRRGRALPAAGAARPALRPAPPARRPRRGRPDAARHGAHHRAAAQRRAARARARAVLRARRVPAYGDGPAPRRAPARGTAASATPSALPIADLHIAPRLDHQRVADCLERLPERERSVLVMTFYDDQPSRSGGAAARAVGRQRSRDPPPRHRQAQALRRRRQESRVKRRLEPSVDRHAAGLLAA